MPFSAEWCREILASSKSRISIHLFTQSQINQSNTRLGPNELLCIHRDRT